MCIWMGLLKTFLCSVKENQRMMLKLYKLIIWTTLVGKSVIGHSLNTNYTGFSDSSFNDEPENTFLGLFIKLC